MKAMMPFADVLKTFGAHGELLIRLRPDAPEEINLSEPVFIFIDGYAVPFYFKQFNTRGNNRALVVFDDMETQDLAQELTGKIIERKGTHDTFTEKTEHTFSVINYEVVDEKIGKIGTVSEFMDIPGNPCLQVKSGEQEILIPFREEMLTVNHKKKIITTNLPDGLAELNQKA
jgi:16S rRNA processing protein RimM